MPNRSEASNREDLIQSVSLSLKVLEMLAESPRSLGVGELAQNLGVGKSRIFRHLQTLVAQGYVAQDELTDKYMIGLAWFMLLSRVEAGPAFGWMVEPLLAELTETTGCAAVIVRYEKDGARAIISVSSKKRISMTVPVGYLMPPHATAFGKIGLAFARSDWVERHMADAPERYTDATIVSLTDLESELAQVRSQGWATSFGEWMTGIAAIAVPVLWADGTATHSIGLMTNDGSRFKSPSQSLLTLLRDADRRLDNLSGDRHC